MSPSPRQLESGRADGKHEEVGRISTATTIFILVVIALLLYELQIVLLPFLVSGLLAYIFTPLVDRLAARTRFSRSFFAVVVFVILLLIAALAGFLGLRPLLRELMRAVTDFQGTIGGLAQAAIGDRSVNVFGQPMNAAQLAQTAVSALREWIGQPRKILLMGEVAFSTVFGFFLSLVLLFYFLYSGPRVMRGLLWLVPPKQRPLILDIWSKLDPVLRRYFVGVLIVVTYAAMAAYVGLGVVLHIPHAISLALLTGFLEMIPVVGPGAAAVIAGLIAVRHATGIGPIIGYAIYATALRLSIDQLLGPLALGTAARLHPVVIIFCFIAGGVLFGISGVIMAVPVALGVKVCLAVLYDEPPGRNEAKPE
jgi:predicted PurR-regulated permease PerM